MGLASFLAKPVSKALTKSVVKQADVVVPKIALDVAESSITNTPSPSKSLVSKRVKPSSSLTKDVVSTQDVADTRVNTDPLFKYEKPIDTTTPVVDDFSVPLKVDRIEDFGVEPELIAESGTDAFKALDLSSEKKEVWRKENKAVQRSKLLPEIEEAAQKLFEGKLKPEEFRKLSAEKQPIVPLDKVPDMPSFTDIAGALTEAQVNKGIVGLNMKIPPGERVSSRLDIPAYNDYNTWIVSLHDGSTKSGAPIGYAKTAVLKNVEFVSDPKVALDIARRKPLGSGGRMGKATIARIFGDYVPHNPDNAKAYAEKIFNDPEWTQIGMNPYRASYFYDKTDNMPVVSADEIVQIGPLVMAKNVKKTKPDDPLFKVNKKDDASPTFAKGGIVKNEMNKLFVEGGIMQEGGTTDPVSGNDVPPGAMQKEVRDDISAKLSEGEFVFPADVVRYIGLKNIMKLRDEAKMGLQKMEEIGQMGNSKSGSEGEALHGAPEEDDEEFSSSIDEIMNSGEDEGEEKQYAAGGYVPAENKALYANAPIKGFEMIPMENATGNVIYIPFIDGKPQLNIPEGYNIKAKVTTTPAATVGEAAKTGAAAGDKAGGGMGSDATGEKAGAWGRATSEERAAFYDANPTMAAITQAGQKAFAATSLGKLQAKMDPNIQAEQAAVAQGRQAYSDYAASKGKSAYGSGYGTSVDSGGFGVTSSAGAGLAASPMSIDPATAQGQRAFAQTAINNSIANNTDPEAEAKDLAESLGVTVGGAMPTTDTVGTDLGTQVDTQSGGFQSSFGSGSVGGTGGSLGTSAQSATDAATSAAAPTGSFGGATYGGNDTGSLGGSTSSGGKAGESGMAQGESQADRGGGGGGGGGAGCFLTTAAVDHMNEKDDGEVLSTLREFRDTYMKKNKEKSKDVAWYYDNAPKIVAAIDARQDAKTLYTKMYNRYIKKAYRQIKNGDLEEAYTTYKAGIDFAKKSANIKKGFLDTRSSVKDSEVKKVKTGFVPR
ncbi:hypothetical protein [Caudoviricetes sp.]|nr:hypothetical protein [Caudoviricetes sp.]